MGTTTPLPMGWNTRLNLAESKTIGPTHRRVPGLCHTTSGICFAAARRAALDSIVAQQFASARENRRIFDRPLKFARPRSSFLPKRSNRRPFTHSRRNGFFVSRASEALDRWGIQHAPGHRGRCALTSACELRSRRHVEPDPIGPGIALRPGIVEVFRCGSSELGTGRPSPGIALFRPILLAGSWLAVRTGDIGSGENE